MLHLSLNARVVSATNLPPVLDEMRRTGATEHGIQRMMAKAGFFAVALEHIGRVQANLLKQEMLASGGDAAVSRGLCSEEVSETGVLLVGSLRQYTALISRLAEEPFGLPEIAREIDRALGAYGRRRYVLRMGDREMTLGPRPALMGVVNVTPDSFSDGGQCLDPGAAIARGEELVAEGADLLDIGGESTRPGADPVTADEELARVLPVLRGLAARTTAPLSIDTRHARVAREAVAAGACLVNDVTGLTGDPEMARAVAETGAGLVVMHILGDPRTMQQNPVYDNLMADVCRFLRRSIVVAREAGVPEDRILIDPGIGFGKRLEHNLQILARLDQLRTLGRPIMVGASRKRFIGEVTGVEVPAERVFGTAAACAMAVAGGALVLRVHDVLQMRQAVAVAAAVVEVGETG
ncbi:MAG: dihydropteroate synthase [Planctomycetota bacterium]|nr:dihydropteroate synthase [Planctomycetota bacterium]